MEKITWRAYEYEQPERPTNWFAALWILAGGLAIVAIILKSYLMAVFVLLAAGVVNITALRKPGLYDFSLDGEKLSIGGKNHELSGFSSFWIFEHSHVNLLNLESKKTISRGLQVPLGDINPNEIRKLLAEVLTESEHTESLMDTLAHWLKF